MLVLFLGGIFDSIFEKVTSLFLFIDGLVYWAISTLFGVYETLAGATIFTSDTYQGIANNLLTIIGVIMLFYLAYALLKALVNPDDIKNTTKIATNLVISLILVSVVPTIFNYAFKLQSAAINEDVVGRIVLGENSDYKYGKIGNVTAMHLLEAFLQIPDKNENGEDIDINNKYANWSSLKACIIDNTISECRHVEDFTSIALTAEIVADDDTPAKYIPLVSTACGIFMAYVILSFCIDLGIRVFKLAFYQILSPIPILMRIIPEKKSVFDNWVKASLATYMEVFVRLFIMYIICYFCIKIFDTNGSILSLSNTGGVFTKVIILLGLFAFAKQAPKLISSVIGIDSGNIKLGIGAKLNDAGFLGKGINAVGNFLSPGKRTIGALAGGLGAGWTSMVNGAGFGSGFKFGSLNGWKGKSKQFGKQRQAIYDAYGLEGDAGWFGGRAYLDDKRNKVKRSVKDAYINTQEGIRSRIEGTEEFGKARKDAIGITIDDLKKELTEQRTAFEENRRKELERIEEQRRVQELRFNAIKDKKLQDLNNQLNKAVMADDATQIGILNELIKKEKNTSFDGSIFEGRKAEEMASTFSNDAISSKISRLQSNNLTDADKKEIEAKASVIYAKDNEKYKAIRTYTNKARSEKDAKKWREDHLDEALAQEKILENAFKASGGKNLGDILKGGSTPPSSGSSGSSGSSSGTGGSK